MAKTRVFVSSTYYDLKYMRDNLYSFIENMGFEPVLFEKGDVHFEPNKNLDLSCYKEIQQCDLFVMIIGGRYGSKATTTNDPFNDQQYKTYNSISTEECNTAIKEGIPTYIFIENAVSNEFATFKKNKDKDLVYAHVDSKNIFLFLEEIENKNNIFLKPFMNFETIESWLKDQWASYFKELLQKRREQTIISETNKKIEEILNTTEVLKKYTEAIIEKVDNQNAKKLIQDAATLTENLKIRQLYEEPMIEFIRIKLNSFSRRIQSKKVYDALKESSSTEAFITSLELPPELEKFFLEERYEKTKKTFEKYKKTYIIGEEYDDNTDEE